METGYLFTVLVFAIAAFHIIWKLVEFATRIYNASGIRPSVQPGAINRDDWYMFFHRSDLTGKDSEHESKRRKESSIQAPKNRDSRPQVRQYLS